MVADAMSDPTTADDARRLRKAGSALSRLRTRVRVLRDSSVWGLKRRDLPVRNWPIPPPNECVRCADCGARVDGDFRRGVPVGSCDCGEGRAPWGR